MTEDSELAGPGVRLTMVITFRNAAQVRVGVKNVKAARDHTGKLVDLGWTLDGDPLGAGIGYIDLNEVIAVHYERAPADAGTCRACGQIAER